MSHIFDPKKFKKLDDPKRKELMPIDKVSDFLCIDSDTLIADVGCGVGYFSIPFSNIAREVYAVDISEIMINELKIRVSQENIRILLGDFSSFLDEDSLDIFFTSTVIHELDDLSDFTNNAYKCVKKGGYIAYLDFMKKEMPFGPDYDKRVSSDDLMSLFKSMGMTDIEMITLSETYYLVKGKK